MENIPLSKKTVVVLKKELAQKTEALNKALKRENELKVSCKHHVHNQVTCLQVSFCVIPYFIFLDIQISLAELQSLLSELEGHNEGQAANIESLTATLKTKDEIISVRIPPFIESNSCHSMKHTAALDKELFFGMHLDLASSPLAVLTFRLCLGAGSAPAPRSERGQSG